MLPITLTMNNQPFFSAFFSVVPVYMVEREAVNEWIVKSDKHPAARRVHRSHPAKTGG